MIERNRLAHLTEWNWLHLNGMEWASAAVQLTSDQLTLFNMPALKCFPFIPLHCRLTSSTAELAEGKGGASEAERRRAEQSSNLSPRCRGMLGRSVTWCDMTWVQRLDGRSYTPTSVWPFRQPYHRTKHLSCWVPSTAWRRWSWNCLTSRIDSSSVMEQNRYWVRMW